MIDIDVIRAGNEIQGFGYLSKGSGSTTINSFSLGAGANSSVYTFNIAAPNTDAFSATQIKFSGVANTDVNNIWLISANGFFRNATPSYDTSFRYAKVGTTVRFYIQFYNSTGVSQTVPTITVSGKAYFHTAPW